MNHSNFKKQAGFSTLEILIALALAVMVITAVMQVSFGAQTLAVDSQTNTEALHKAQEILDFALETSRNNFDSVVTLPGTYQPNGVGLTYNTLLDIPLGTPCLKNATSTVTWLGDHNRSEQVTLKTQLVNVPEMLSTNGRCNISYTSGWVHPNTLISRDLDKHVSYGDNASVNSSAGNQATGVAVLNNKIYMTAIESSAPKDDFFILDNSNILHSPPVYPPILGSVNTGPGLNGLTVVKDPVSGIIYAYALNNSNTNQLQVLDVSTDPTNPTVLPAASRTLPNMVFTCSPPSKPCLAGQSIYYYAGKIYIGTQYVAFGSPGENHEFHIYCLAPDSAYPACASSSFSNPVWAASVNVNHNINAILVHGHYAFLATSDDNGELTVLNLNSLSSPAIKFAATGNEYGTSLYLNWPLLYLGRERATGSDKDFLILDVSNLPTSVTNCTGCYKRLGLHTNTAVTGVIAAGPYVFLALSDPNPGFEVLDISTAASVDTKSPISSFNFSQATVALDIDNNGFMYTANSSNDALRIIRPSECADKIDDDLDGKIDITDSNCHSDGIASNLASYKPDNDE